jgi:hypothetical protein
VTGFDIVDRYDVAMWILFDIVIAGALVLGAPLWSTGLAMLVVCIVVFVRHFDEIMAP